MRNLTFLFIFLFLNSCTIHSVVMTGGDNKEYFSFEEIKSDVDRRYKKMCSTELSQFNEVNESITLFIPNLEELQSLVSNPDTDWKAKNDSGNWSSRANALVTIYSYNLFSKCNVFEKMFSSVNYELYNIKLNISGKEAKFWDKLTIPNKTYSSKYAIFMDDTSFIMENSENGLYEKFDTDYFHQLFNPFKNEETEFTLASFYDYFLDTKKLID